MYLFLPSKSFLPFPFFPSRMASWGIKESESDQEQEEEVILQQSHLFLAISLLEPPIRAYGWPLILRK